MGTKKLSEKWPQRHAESLKKWQEIREKVERKIPFDCHSGWKDLILKDSCGYCSEFFDKNSEEYCCSKCPLFLKLHCSDNGYSDTDLVFWKFVRMMKHSFFRKKPFDCNEALKLVDLMIEAIKEDIPKKEEEKV